MCLYPKLIINKKYIANKKNNGQIPSLKDERVLYVPVGCGNCIECRKQYARNWQIRLNEEIKSNKNAHMVSLTFSEEYLTELTLEIEKTKQYHKLEENETAKLAVRRFLERWRKKYKKSIKHWLITELGHTGTERIHLHGIIWTENKDDIEIIWKYGYVHIGQFVNEKTINYIIKYVTKIDKDHKGYKPKILCSPGIGKNYLNKTDSRLNKYKGKETIEYYRTPTGLKLNLCTYYRNKIYTEEEREQLWINKLDKQERWVCGEKIDISKSEESYEKTLKFYQTKNKRLGYGDGSEDWNIKMYRKSRKNLIRRKKNK